MAAGKSTLGTAQQMMLTVGQAYDAVVRGMARYLQHLREREAHLRAMLNDSHQPDVSAMLAEVVAAITAPRKRSGSSSRAGPGAVRRGADRPGRRRATHPAVVAEWLAYSPDHLARLVADARPALPGADGHLARAGRQG